MKRSFIFVKMLKQDFHCGQLDSDGHLRIATSTVDLVGGTGSGVVHHELSIQRFITTSYHIQLVILTPSLPMVYQFYGTTLKPLITLQQNATRSVTFSKTDEHPEPLLRNSRSLN